jgi:hypothetical protein
MSSKQIGVTKRLVPVRPCSGKTVSASAGPVLTL